MSDERWQAVPGLEGQYEVSSMGRVRSLDRRDSRGSRRTGVTLRAYRDGHDGYVAVDLAGRRTKVHRLVLMAFLGDREDLQVNHLNGVRNDNRLQNLEWCTASQNIRHSYDALARRRAGGHSGKFGDAHHQSKAVLGARIPGDNWERFGSTEEAARHLGLRRESISRAAAGKYRHTGGWKFQWEADARKAGRKEIE